jgi:hypothetical protein
MTESIQNDGAFRGARGGRRLGAGRPSSYREPLVRKTVTLPVSYVEQLTTFGVGNLSDGIRLLVELAYTRNGTPWFSPTPLGSIAPPQPFLPSRR